jgi:hypothetical protein
LRQVERRILVRRLLSDEPENIVIIQSYQTIGGFVVAVSLDFAYQALDFCHHVTFFLACPFIYSFGVGK